MYLDLDRKDPLKPAAIDSDGVELSYGGLVSFAGRLGEVLPSRSLALILSENSVASIAAFVGCVASDVVPLPIARTVPRGTINSYLDLYHPSWVLGSFDDLLSLGFDEAIHIDDALDVWAAATHLEPFPLYGDLAMLLTTSGSTGSPKLVRHSHGNLRAQARNISAFFELDGTERPIVDLPTVYTYGLSVAYSHLQAGATLLLTHESLMSRRFWQFSREQEATSITGVPYTFEVLNRLGLSRMNLPTLRQISQGGGRLPAPLQREFASYIMSRGGRYWATYGQTECTARMAYLPPELALEKCGSIGRAIPQGTLSLRGEDGAVILGAHEEGEMHYAGPNVTLGYAYTGADLIRGDEFGGEVATGDLAWRDEDGLYYISGRKSRFLKLFGYRVSLDECERLVQDALGIECACTGSDEGLALCVTETSMAERARRHLLDATKLYPNSVRVYILPEIPRNPAGKVRYRELDSAIGDWNS